MIRALLEILAAILAGYRYGTVRAHDAAMEESDAIATKVAAAVEHAPNTNSELARRLLDGPGA